MKSKMNWKLVFIGVAVLAVQACNTESDITIEEFDKKFEAHGFESKGFKYDGEYFDRIIKQDIDGSIQFFDEASEINHAWYEELMASSPVVKYVAGDPTTYFYSSQEIFEKIDKFLEGTNPKLDNSGSEEEYRASIESKQEAGRVLRPIQAIPGGWDWAGSSIKMWQTENYQGAEVNAITSWRAISIDGFQGGATENFVGITANHVNAHLKTPGHFSNPDSAQVFLGEIGLMEDDAESIRIDNWSTRDLRVQFYAFWDGRTICGLPQTHLIVDVSELPATGRHTHFSSALSF
ncbi:hypothetical protein [Ekhidna sp.]